MKVLIINGSLHKGSTGKIAYGMHRMLLDDGHESIFAYGDYSDTADTDKEVCISSKKEQTLHKVYNCITGYNSAFAPLAMHRLEKIIREYRPDIIQLYNLHGYYLNIYKLFGLIKKYSIRAVYGMIDEHPYLGYCTYAYDCEQWKTGCENCELVIRHGYMNFWGRCKGRQTFLKKKKAYDSVSDIVYTGPGWVIERAKESTLLRDKKLVVLDEYIDTDNTFIPKKTDKLRRELGIGDNDIVVLNVARSDDKRKGVDYYIELARHTSENVKYINVGYVGDKEGLPDNYIPVNLVKDQDELAEYYSLADTLICTSMADTMPNVCLDALSCGTPVCGFDVTGTPYVADKPLGQFVSLGDIEGLKRIVLGNGKKTEDISKKCREYAISRYSPGAYYAKAMDIYKKILDK